MTPPSSKPERVLKPIGAAIDKSLVISELKASAEVLIDTQPDRPEKGMCVWRAVGRDIPNTMLEIGRLREETFRTVGEGTGEERDTDHFDTHYDHFIAWDKGKQEITGAYRIGRVDKILKDLGPAGIYTNTLFHLEHLLATDFSEGTLEAGRSFVRPEYQRGPTLLVIWMGLGHFIASNPEYKYLMGPVSISNEFQENSKHIMVSYLMKHHPHEKSDLVQPKNPPNFKSDFSKDELAEIVDSSIGLTNLQEFVRQSEGNPKAQIPQLIKLYLELGVRFLAFHKDEDFNSIDGLIWLDITQIPEDIVVRYMTEDGWKNYKTFHF